MNTIYIPWPLNKRPFLNQFVNILINRFTKSDFCVTVNLIIKTIKMAAIDNLRQQRIT
jgi:hypothetical protein